MSIQLLGNWHKGIAFDRHIQQSIFLGEDDFGHPQFDSQRTEMGELVYQLKYHHQWHNVVKIVDLLVNNISGFQNFDMIVPAPFSQTRQNQPVVLICQELSNRLKLLYQKDVPVCELLQKTSGTQLKNVDSKSEKLTILRSDMVVQNQNLSGKKILLIDDLYDSGATLEVATEKLLAQNAQKVCVLTMTKTKG